MRFVRRRSNGETVSLAPIFVALLLVVLAGLGTWGVVAVKGSPPASGNRLVPPKNYAALPPMTFTLGGGDARLVDVRVLLEIDPSVDPKQAISFVPRIADQMADRMRQIEPEQLSGAEGARLMKSALSAVVGHEARSMRVREVLLERMVVR